LISFNKFHVPCEQFAEYQDLLQSGTLLLAEGEVSLDDFNGFCAQLSRLCM